jgi:TPR repeat protein
MKCPSCQSERIRHSRHRVEDGLWRSIFFTAYRCRDCGKRFQKLTRGLLLGAVIAAILVSTFSLGWLFASSNGDPGPPAALAVTAAPPDLTERPAEAAPPQISSAEIALAAEAESGDPQAQYRLGMAYFKGAGIERDSALALKWIQRAADQGYGQAQYTLGAMHHAGRGALQSFPLALKWFEQAAQQNHAEAQYSLGSMYRSGQGVPVDKSKAYIWFNLAAAQGHERAGEARDNLLPALTPEQVLAAQKAAQEWRPATAKTPQ